MKWKKMNLQLFADAHEQLQNTTGSSGMSAEMKTFYERRLIDQALPALVHDQFGDSYPIPANNGKTIEFRKYDALPKATTPLTEGVTPEGQALTVTTVTAEVHQYGGWVPLTDMVQMTTIDNNVVQATSVLASQSGRTMDTIVRDILCGGTNVIYAPKIGTGGAETPVTSRAGLDATAQLTVDLIDQAVAQLKVQNADPIGSAGGSYVAIIHPYAAYDIKKDPNWVEAHKYASPEEIFEGEIGKIEGCRFVESTEAKIFHAADLAGDSRTLLTAGAVSGKTTFPFDGGTVQAGALVGRQVLIGNACVTVTANTASSMTVDAAVTAEDNAIIYPGEAGAQGRDVYVTLVLGADGYGTTEITGGGLEHIVKQLGSAGTGDPLNQRASVGWKATKVAVRLDDSAIRRIETCSTYTE